MPLHDRLRPPTLELPASSPGHGLAIGVAFAVLAAGFAFAMPRALQVSADDMPPKVQAVQGDPSPSPFGAAGPEEAEVGGSDDDENKDDKDKRKLDDDDTTTKDRTATPEADVPAADNELTEDNTQEPRDDPEEPGTDQEPARLEEDDDSEDDSDDDSEDDSDDDSEDDSDDDSEDDSDGSDGSDSKDED